MQRSNALCFKHHHSEKGTRTATFRMPSDSAGILIGMTATRALISLGMIQSGLTGIFSSWDAVEQEICADVFLQDGGIGSASLGHGTKSQILPGTRVPGSSSSSSEYFSLDMCSAAHKADKNKVLTECLNANFSNCALLCIVDICKKKKREEKEAFRRKSLTSQNILRWY